MVIRKEPGASDPASPFDGGRKTTRHAFFANKVIANAVKHGAKAVLIINDPSTAFERPPRIVQNRIDQRSPKRKAQRLEDSCSPSCRPMPPSRIEKLPRSKRKSWVPRTLDPDRACRPIWKRPHKKVFWTIGGCGNRVETVRQESPLYRSPVISPTVMLRPQREVHLSQARATQINNATFQPASSSPSPESPRELSVDLKPAVAVTRNNVIGHLAWQG